MQESNGSSYDKDYKNTEENAGKTSRTAAKTVAGKLDAMLEELPEDDMTLREMRDLVEEDGLLVLTVFLCIVFMIPVSIPGVSTVFGGAILLIGICRTFSHTLWLPGKLLERKLPSDKVKSALRKGRKWALWAEKISRPGRMEWILGTGGRETMANIALVYGAILLMAPFGGIPFSNTLPALAIILLAMGMLQRDGQSVLLGHVMNLASTLYFFFLFYGGWALLKKLYQSLFQ